MRRRGPGETDPDSDERVAETDLPVADVLLPEQDHRQETEQDEDVAQEQREAGAARLDDLGRARRDEHHAERGRKDREPGIERRVAEHVLEELLPDEHRAHQRAEDDDSCAGRHPERRPCGDREVVERVPCAALAEVEEPEPDHGDDREHDRQRRRVGNRREVDRQDQRTHQDQREEASEVVDRLGPLVDVSRHVLAGHVDRHDRQRERQPEGRPPVEVLQQEARQQRAERRDRASEAGPQRNRLRPPGPGRPQRGDQRKRRRIRHPRREPAADPRQREHDVRGSERGKHDIGIARTVPRGASSSARSGRRARRARAPSTRARASSRPRSCPGSSGRSRSAPRSTGARRSRPRGSGSRPLRRGSVRTGPDRRAAARLSSLKRSRSPAAMIDDRQGLRHRPDRMT